MGASTLAPPVKTEFWASAASTNCVCRAMRLSSARGRLAGCAARTHGGASTLTLTRPSIT